MTTYKIEDIKEEELVLKKLRNGRTPSPEHISNELLKYEAEKLTQHLTSLINNKILYFYRIPDGCKSVL